MKITVQELITVFENGHDKRRLENPAIQSFQKSQPPERLYHYTSAAGLKGIVEGGELWCTSAAFFNDASEVVYGLSQVRKALKVAETDPGFVEMVKDIYVDIRETLDIFAACFCKRADLLQQWHGYGDRGGRYCIGLSTADLTSIIAGRDLMLVRVVYDPDEQMELIQAQISTAAEALNHTILSYDIDEKQLEQLKSHSLFAILSSLSIVVAAMKDPIFQTEEEWRLVHFRGRQLESRADVAFRISGKLVIPYIPTRLCFKNTKRLPIREIIIGPTVNPLAARSVKDLLRRYDMANVNGHNVEVKTSAIPLQNLI